MKKNEKIIQEEELFVPNDEPLLSVKQDTLAMEMLKELKKSAQRKFIIIIILIIALIATNLGWFIYESQFETITETEETTQTIEDVDNAQNATISQTIN